jgi:hypothetical protein
VFRYPQPQFKVSATDRLAGIRRGRPDESATATKQRSSSLWPTNMMPTKR